MAKKDKFIVYTPVVELGYGFLRTPDTKFNADGDFKQDFYMSPEAAKAWVASIEADPRVKVNGKPAKLKFTKVDGLLKFRTKQHAKIKNKAGETFDVQIRLYHIVDGKTVEYPDDAPIPYSGSKAELEVEIVPYEGFGGGLTLRLRAVRLHEIVQGKSGGNGNWGEVEEGYTSGAIARPSSDAGADFDDDAESDDDGDEDARW